MIWYQVLWLSMLCPGGMLKGLVPQNLRPLVCEVTPAVAVYASEQQALEKIRELGPRAKLQVCEDRKGILDCKSTTIRWEPSIQEE